MSSSSSSTSPAAGGASAGGGSAGGAGGASSTSPSTTNATVIVVGTGLAGATATLTAAQLGAKVIVLDKGAVGKGNTSKATSGINCVGSSVQISRGVLDSVDLFVKDVVKSCRAGHRDNLIRILAEGSLKVESYFAAFGVELNALSHCGGHSVPRTTRSLGAAGKPAPPIGFHTISSLWNHIRENYPSVEIHTQADVKKLLTEIRPMPFFNTVVGVEYEHCSEGSDPVTKSLRADAVILCTGGFAFDRSPESFLAEFAPWALALPCTCGPSASGDGIRLARDAGAHLVDMGLLQLHPTAFVDPMEPNSRHKFLAPEALRGLGGILVNPLDGKRFVNELTTRDLVSNAEMKHCPGIEIEGSPGSLTEPASFVTGTARPCFSGLLMSAKCKENFGPNFDFYVAKGFIKAASTANEVAASLESTVTGAQILETLAEYKSHVEAGRDPFGKTAFPDSFDDTVPDGAGPDTTFSLPLYVARVGPALHYTMGGVAFTGAAEALRIEDEALDPLFAVEHKADDALPLEPPPPILRQIPGLFVAGETSGGLHCHNRLAGNSLLECVVFGSIAGERAAHCIPSPPGNISSDAFGVCTLREVEMESTSVYRCRFNLPSPISNLPCGPGDYVAVKAIIEGEEVVRFYSPISRPSALGYVDLLIKCDATAGKMSSHLVNLRPGESIEIKGPMGGPALDLSPTAPRKKLGLIAGGTGVAPMCQILRELFYSGRTDMDVSMIYACPSPDAFPFYEILTRKAATHPFFKLTCAVDATNGLPWEELVGFVDKECIRANMPPPGPDVFIYLCGPPPMCRAVKAILPELGYTPEMFYSCM